MNPRVRLPVPPRPRRSQADRVTETRQKILAAVVESVDEIGLARTTANEIARRAGVSWGAVQHHFGDKDGILVAVLEASFNRFTEVLSDLPDADLPDAERPLAERVSLFIDRSWQHFGSTHYRSTVEILMNPPPELAWKNEMITAWIRIWATFFPESTASDEESAGIMRYTVSVLSGLATTNMIDRDASRNPTRELEFLKRWLAGELSGNRVNGS